MTSPPGRTPTHPAKRLTLLLNVRDHVSRRSLLIELMQRARHAKLAGATVFHASEGYGSAGTVHRAHAFSEDVPVSVVVVDTAESIDSFLAANGDILDEVVVTVADVEVVHLRPPGP